MNSRIENVKEFISSVESLGFQLSSKDDSSTFFVILDFKKTGAGVATEVVLKPCLYKRR